MTHRLVMVALGSTALMSCLVIAVMKIPAAVAFVRDEMPRFKQERKSYKGNKMEKL